MYKGSLLEFSGDGGLLDRVALVVACLVVFVMVFVYCLYNTRFVRGR